MEWTMRLPKRAERQTGRGWAVAALASILLVMTLGKRFA
ncbi:major facilitator superfamily MFS_1 domain protein [Geobacillus kaustophilus]|uniref:Major facilitator superfamily MFS_1 domain protein n=1 Tax=Geobacillus kaustophilus TaxID=1462 RepID=A0A0D8BS17_GEOKU|nr:major facilitator superfamily MFS_1 domain protein [Geobacillus kaustophilus]